jgi:hypothetical protein
MHCRAQEGLHRAAGLFATEQLDEQGIPNYTYDYRPAAVGR